jgi:DNA-binding winged helix-turn-helix (wHTH) protein
LNQFFINNIRVDADRCRVFRDGETLSLEPRVIQVLVFLARHPGDVVSHQTLLAAIWTNTIVDPSALQRCIAQLRKAFRDDARQQRVIATYPKKGYSLVAQVRWQDEQPGAPVQALNTWLRPALAAGIAAVLFLAIGLASLPSADDAPAPQSLSATPAAPAAGGHTPVVRQALLAAISDPDDFPVYSPDGRYVVYPRYLEERRAHLWARDLAYGNDFLLTEEAGVYEHLAWSADSSQLVFVDASCLLERCAERQCASLKSVSISQSETNILSVQKLIDCSPYRLLSPEWLNGRELVVIEMNADEAMLSRFDIRTKSREELYQSRDMLPYHLSYSRQATTLTIMAINPYGRKELLFLDTRTGTLNRNETAEFVPDENWYPSSFPP